MTKARDGNCGLLVKMAPKSFLSAILGATFALLLFSGPPAGAVEIRTFDDPALDARFRTLTYELRCLVCQNQNIADSDAELAQDLRGEVDRMLREGKTDNDITDFMVARYGEFVLYRPRLRAGTIALWVGPFVLVGAGLVLLVSTIRKTRRNTAAPSPLEQDEETRVNALLGDRDGTC
ncbi:MAG: cytochrome c-type biogenesis protein CcmH [Gammaproteobacteria bacterium]|jgi:cytochrome c-type biogenesis protein CcmH